MIGTDDQSGFWKTVAAVAIGVFIGGTLVLPTTILIVDLLLRVTGVD